MKLSADDKVRLASIGQTYIKALEHLSARNFSFDAAIESMKMLRDALRILININSRYMGIMVNLASDLNETSNINFIKRLKLKYDIHAVQQLLKDVYACIFPKDCKEKMEKIFKDAPIKSLNVKEDYKENSRQFGVFGLFQSTRTHTLDCSIKFANGKSLSWHTLDAGPELEQAREVYNQNLKELGHIEILHVEIPRRTAA